jgi:hypothetical protein
LSISQNSSPRPGRIHRVQLLRVLRTQFGVQFEVRDEAYVIERDDKRVTISKSVDGSDMVYGRAVCEILLRLGIAESAYIEALETVAAAAKG